MVDHRDGFIYVVQIFLEQQRQIINPIGSLMYERQILLTTYILLFVPVAPEIEMELHILTEKTNEQRRMVFLVYYLDLTLCK
jgi:hypothetical protein